MEGKKRPVLDIKMKKLKKTTADIYLSEFKTYTEMREDIFRQEKERKSKIEFGYQTGQQGAQIGHGQAKGVGFKGVDEQDLIEKRSKVICRAKKNHRFKACTKCEGCRRKTAENAPTVWTCPSLEVRDS